MIVDMHVHLLEERMYPKKFLESLYEQKRSVMSEKEFKRYKAEAKAETLIADMDKAGVDVSVCLPVDLAFAQHDESEISIWKANEYVADAQARYPDRIIGFFGCDPFRPGSVDMLEKGINHLGLRGVKIIPSWFFPTDERVAPFIQKIEELNVPVLFHSGASDPLPILAKYGSPIHLDDLMLRYPKLKIIAAHISRGWEDLLIQMIVYRLGRIWTEVAGLQFEFVSSRWHFLMKIRYAMDRVPDAILFGSDWPWLKSGFFPSHKEWVKAFRNMMLPEGCLDMGMKQFSKDERDKILGGNAVKLLNL